MVMEWLSSVDVTESHYAARAKHEQGTGDWLLVSEGFALWLTGTMELMWLYGIPGSGKTVHCSTIIKYVQGICAGDEKQKSRCIYYYFDFKDHRRQTLDDFIRSALAQFCQQSRIIPREVMALHEKRGRKGQDPTPARLVETLLILLFDLLLTHDADVNIVAGYYGSAVQAAQRLIIEYGADLNIVAGQFGTGLQAAARYGHEELVMLLLERGADPNARGGYYHTALQAAARGGHVDIVRVLLEHGADVNVEGGFCGNALMAARSRRNYAVVDILQERLKALTVTAEDRSRA